MEELKGEGFIKRGAYYAIYFGSKGVNNGYTNYGTK